MHNFRFGTFEAVAHREESFCSTGATVRDEMCAKLYEQ